MSRSRRLLLVLVPLFFVLGAYQGRRLFDARARQSAEASLPKVSVLGYEGFFSEAFLRALRAQEGISVELDVARTADEAMRKFLADPARYDLVTLFNWQVAQAAKQLSPLAAKGRLKSALADLSADLRFEPKEMAKDAPQGMLQDMMVPLVWGAVGFVYDRARLGEKSGEALFSWGQALARPSLRKKILLLNSPIDLAYLAEQRAPAPADPASGEGLSRLRKPLAQIAEMATIEGGPWRTGLGGPAPSVPPVVQMSQGEAAFWLGAPDGKKWAFVIPEEGANIWTMGLALSATGAGSPGQAKRRSQAESLVAFALTGAGSDAIAREARAASTNRLEETSDVDARLKPSFVREIPLTRVRPAPSFEDGGAIATMLGK
jgi:spermidine/putrescine-binding protein